MSRKKTNFVANACAAVGSQRALAKVLGVTEQAMCVWVKQGWVPLGRAREIEHATGVPRTNLVKPQLLELLNTEIL